MTCREILSTAGGRKIRTFSSDGQARETYSLYGAGGESTNSTNTVFDIYIANCNIC
jgi:hypothetical protein